MMRRWWKKADPPPKIDGTIGAEVFAHGRHYGDISGVVFLGAPMDGVWYDRLPISDRFISPLFQAILDRCQPPVQVPELVAQWNTDSGWVMATEPTGLRRHEARALVIALRQLTEEDLRPHCAGCTPEECLRCGAAIDTYISAKLDAWSSLYLLRE